MNNFEKCVDHETRLQNLSEKVQYVTFLFEKSFPECIRLILNSVQCVPNEVLAPEIFFQQNFLHENQPLATKTSTFAFSLGFNCPM